MFKFILFQLISISYAYAQLSNVSICTPIKRDKSSPTTPTQESHIKQMEYIFTAVESDGKVQCKEVEALVSTLKSIKGRDENDSQLDGCETVYEKEITLFHQEMKCSFSLSFEPDAENFRKPTSHTIENADAIDAIKEEDPMKEFEEAAEKSSAASDSAVPDDEEEDDEVDSPSKDEEFSESDNTVKKRQ